MSIARVLYIAGTGRSGSTVITQLLGEIEGIIPVGELRYVWERGFQQNQLCGCGVPFRSCDFWSRVATSAFGGIDKRVAAEVMQISNSLDRIRFTPQLLVRSLRGAAFQRQLVLYDSLVGTLYGAILAVSGGSMVVDSSKDPSYAFLLRSLPSLDVAILHLVRDPRAVAYSWSRKRIRPEVHWKTQYMQRRSALRSALLWDEYNLILEILGQLHSTFSRIRYEDFVSDPSTVIASLVAFAGARDGRICDPGSEFVHSVSGNPSRFQSQRPVIRADVEWRNHMRPSDRRVVTTLTAPLLFRYGYVRSQRDWPNSRAT